MILDDKQLEEVARAMTGRNERGQNAIIKHYGSRALEVHQQLKDLENKIKRLTEDRTMFYQMWKMSGGMTPDERTPPEEFDETLFVQPELHLVRPARLDTTKPLKLNWKPDADPNADPDEPVTIQRRKHTIKKPRLEFNAAEYAAFWDLVHEQYGVYPPDEFGSQFYQCSVPTVTRRRLEAKALGLIVAEPTDKRSQAWKNAHVTLHGVRDALGAA